MDTQIQGARQKHQKGLAKQKARQAYMRNRGKSKINAKKNYHRKKNQHSFKKKQRIRRKKPWLSKRRHGADQLAVEDVQGQALTVAGIVFVHPDTGELAEIREISPMTGMVNYMIGGTPGSMDVEDLMVGAEFVSLEDIENLYDLLDRTFLSEDEEAVFDAADERYEQAHPEEFKIPLVEDEQADRLAKLYLLRTAK